MPVPIFTFRIQKCVYPKVRFYIPSAVSFCVKVFA